MKSWKFWLAVAALVLSGCSLQDVCSKGDTDGDGSNDCEDECPNNPIKISKTDSCGCGLIVEVDGESICTCFLNDVYVCEGENTGEKLDDEDGLCKKGTVKEGKEPGICGCAKEDTDSDDDGTPDCNDECPDNPKKIKKDKCGCDDVSASNPDACATCAEGSLKKEPGICGCDMLDEDLNGNGVIDCTEEPPVVDPPVEDPPVEDPPVEKPPEQPVCGNNLVEEGEECDAEVVECSDFDPKLAGTASCMNCQVVLSECGSDADGDGALDENDVCPFNPEIRDEDDYKTVGLASCASYKQGEVQEERIEGYEIHLYPGSFLTNERLEKYPPARIVIHGTINFYYKDMSNADMGMSVEHIEEEYIDGRPGIQFIPLKIPKDTQIVGVDNAKLEFVKNDKRGILSAPLFDTLQNCTIKDLHIDLDFDNQRMTNVELRGSITNELKSSELNNVGYSGSLTTHSDRQDVGGMVGTVDAASSLYDVYIENVNISSGDYYSIQNMGGIAGRVLTPNVTVKESKNVSVHGYYYVGGLFGLCSAAMNFENLTASSLSTIGYSNVGGIIGSISTGGLTLTKSEINIDNVTCEGSSCGGLVGEIRNANFSFDTIDLSIANLTGESYVGGLVGLINNTTNNTSAFNKVASVIDNLNCTSSYCGGLVGSITGSYNTNYAVFSKIVSEVNSFDCKGSYCAGIIGQSSAYNNISDVLLIVKLMTGNYSAGLIAYAYGSYKLMISRLVSLVQFSQSHNYALFYDSVSQSYFTPKDIYWYKLEDDYSTNLSSLSQEMQNEIQAVVPQKTDVHQIVKKLRSEVMADPENDCDWSDDKIQLPAKDADGSEIEVDIPMLSWKQKDSPA